MTLPKARTIRTNSEEFAVKFVDTPVALANAVRRTILADVPTAAIEKVSVIDNNGVLPDEMIAHRLGMVPLVSKRLDELLSRHECPCEGQLCSLCSVELSLNVTCQNTRKDVTARDILSVDGTAKTVLQSPEDQGVLIAVLTRGQRLSLRMKAAKGTGREHAKWMPCTTSRWHYEDSPAGPDGPTTVMLTLELNGTVNGEKILSCACTLLREKLSKIHSSIP